MYQVYLQKIVLGMSHSESLLLHRYVVGIIWVFCTTFSLLPLFNVGQLFLQYPGTWCFAQMHLCGSDTLLRHRIYTNVLAVTNVLNLLVIIVCNILVVGEYVLCSSSLLSYNNIILRTFKSIIGCFCCLQVQYLLLYFSMYKIQPCPWNL